MVDLGSEILRQFKEWPSTPHLNPNLSPPIEHRLNADSCFTLHKLSDTGCSLELGFAQSGAFLIDQVVVEALTSLFNNGEMPNKVKGILASNMNSKQLSNVDNGYLVKVSQNRISEVWDANRNSFDIR